MLLRIILPALIGLAAGFGGAALWSTLGLGHQKTRDYLVSNPQVLEDMVASLRQEENRERLAQLGNLVVQPYPGAVLGNPNGSKTLVKFTDYGCGYCRASVADIEQLIAEDPELRVVIREWPIFEGSDLAARMSLAAAAQGKYDAFYHAMFENGPPNEESVEAAAQAAGLDMAEARAFAASDATTREIAKNTRMAQQLGFTGTPSWVVGDEILEGAVGYESLKMALSEEAIS